ncbi:MAG: terminase small subunit, partial [Candidatus Methylomirabilota bacterium]
ILYHSVTTLSSGIFGFSFRGAIHQAVDTLPVRVYASAMERLTLKQRRFVEAWLSCRNATRAAREAGYSARCAQTISSRMLRNRAVVRAIEARQDQIADKADVNKAGIVKLLTAMLYTDLRDVMEWDGTTLTVKSFADIPEWVHPAIQEIRQRERVGRNGEVTSRSLEIKLVPRMDIVRELNEMLGYHAPRQIEQQTLPTLGLFIDLRGRQPAKAIREPEGTPA